VIQFEKSRSPFELRLFLDSRERDQAALAFVCCKRRASLAETRIERKSDLDPNNLGLAAASNVRPGPATV
jgi:hypothetical protein